MALFEIGADTTSLKVLRDDELLYDRDQAFGGSQLTQLISSRQYGFSFEEAEAKKLGGDLPEDYEGAILTPFVDSLSQEIGRALQYFFTSTPHHKVHYVMLAGGTATLHGPEGTRHRPDRLRLDGGQPVRAHEARRRGAREQGAARGALVPHGHVAWPCGGSCSDPDQPASPPGRKAQAPQALPTSAGLVLAGDRGRR